jgi:hypothetical protein
LSGLGIVRESLDLTPEAGLKWYGLCRTTRKKTMKKLMIAAAAAVCGSVFALESANIVGFQDYPLVQGYNLYSPVFEAVGETMSLQDLKIKGESVTGSGANLICLLDSDGVAQGTIGWWMPSDGTGEENGCWFDGDNWCLVEETVAPGQGFYLYAEDAGLSIQSSGSVRLTNYSKELTKGYNLVGNTSPADLDIQSIKIVGEAVTGSGANLICLLDSDGVAQGTIGWWMPADGTGEEGGCWFDGDNWCLVEDTVAAGQGLYVYAEDEGLKLEFPTAIK